MSHRQQLIDAIAKLGDLSAQDAEKAFKNLLIVRGIVFNAHDGYTVTFGGYMDREVLRRAALAEF